MDVAVLACFLCRESTYSFCLKRQNKKKATLEKMMLYVRLLFGLDVT